MKYLTLFISFVSILTTAATPSGVELTADWNTRCVLERLAPGSGPLECWFAGTGAEWKSWIKRDNVSQMSSAEFGVDTGRMIWTQIEICTIQNRKLQCYGNIPDPVNAHFADMKDVTLVANGKAGVCVYDEKLGTRCFERSSLQSRGYRVEDNALTTISSVPALGKIKLLAVGDQAACAIDENNRARCWGGRSKDSDRSYHDSYLNKLLSAPSKFRNPTKLSVGDNNACVVDEENLTCWGDERYLPRRTNGVKDVSLRDYWGCAIYQTGAECWGTFEAANMNAVLVTAADPIAIGVGTRTACVVEERGSVHCFNYDRQTRITRTSVDIFRLASVLSWAAQYVYDSKSELLDKAAKLLDEVPRDAADESAIRTRLFVMDVLSPFLENLDTAWATEKLLPSYRETLERYRRQLNVTRLQDYPLGPKLVKIAISLAEGGLKVGERYLTTPELREAAQTLRVALGIASANSDGPAAAQALARASALLETMVANPRARGAALMVMGLAGYLSR